MTELLYKDEVYSIIGAAMEVHKELGQGFLESVYQETLSIELKKRNIPFSKETKLNILYKGIDINKFFISDFVCYNKIIVELKALSGIAPEHEAQVINYLKATNYRLGLIINFGSKSLQYKRIIN